MCPVQGVRQRSKDLLQRQLPVPEHNVACMADEQEALPAYFAGTPPTFQAAADVLLEVHGGVQLPAHSQLLACVSPVLSDLLVSASQVAAGGKTVLPLVDFSEREAIDVLKARVADRHCALPFRT